MDRRQAPAPILDERSLKISVQYAVALMLVVGGGVASYFGGRLATEKNFSDLRERITKVEASTIDLAAVRDQLEKNNLNVANMRQGLWILLHDRGYDADKIIGKINE